MPPMTSTLVWCFIAITLTMSLLWLVSLVRRDASIVDPFWGTGFVLVAWLAYGLNEPVSARITLLSLLVTVWGMRLSLFLLWRNAGHGEDRRYAAMRKKHGRHFWWVSLCTVFLLQSIILWFVSLPIQAAAVYNQPTAFGWLDTTGILLWGIGFSFETIGDWQLARFKADPANASQVMDRGLWHYTRHPNYFGDFCVWWGIYLIATAGGAGWTIGSPLLMSVLLMKVSGVTLLESDIGERRPDYAAYKARTSPFIPWPPKG
ncbi:MAG: DUF1295 domain-containing protein [Planctomycetota bacterium]|nr:DUF1295 domain-containing protein [Planctomycetota bacterium]